MDSNTEIDIRVAEIISEFMELSSGRIVISGQNYKAPKDDGIYIIVSMRAPYVLGQKKYFDNATNEEVNEVSMFASIDIEVTSKSREAMNRKEEVVMALTSYQSIALQEKYGFKLFRNSSIMDLTFIEASASLYRYRVPITATYNKIKRSGVDYYDKFRTAQLEIER